MKSIIPDAKNKKTLSTSGNWLAEEMAKDSKAQAKSSSVIKFYAVLWLVVLIAGGAIVVSSAKRASSNSSQPVAAAPSNTASAAQPGQTPAPAGSNGLSGGLNTSAASSLTALTTADYNTIQAAITAANSMTTALNTDNESLAKIDFSQFQSAVYGVEDIQTTKYTPTLSSDLSQLSNDLESASSDYTQSFNALEQYETDLSEETTSIGTSGLNPYSSSAQSEESDVTFYLNSASDETSSANFEITELNVTH